jgi:hypothetical protein
MNRSLIRSVLLAFQMVAVVCLTCGSAAAQKGVRKPDPSGNSAKWDWQVTDESDKLIEKGFFTVKGFVIFHHGKQIGNYESASENQVKANISSGRLKGTLNLTRTPPSPNWKGELERQSGGKYQINVVFEKFR